MNTSIKGNGAATVLAFLAVASGSLTIAACESDVPTVSRAVDVSTVAPCPGEAGPGNQAQAPCVWDGLSQGNGTFTGARWLYYASGQCDGLTFVQPEVECIEP